ncbi:MAG: hypothetical protein P1V20_13975 [Verrucomicrobiales bacterium]|nr:hypothetical protein [Verrucomicrobiales bacterium]
MTTETRLQFLLVIVALGTTPFSLMAGDDVVEGFKWFGGNSHHSDTPVSVVSNNLNQNVYMLDTLADQMVFRYGWAVKTKKDDPNAEILHKYMKRHAVLTNALVKASRGKDAEVFKEAAIDVRKSVVILQKLAERTEVGKPVARMIANSGPLAEFVCANIDQFRAGPSLLPGRLFGKSKPVFQATIPMSRR